MVNIYYDSMTYVSIDEQPSLTFDILLANIGGNFGLFTGMSILSFVEFIEIFILIGMEYFRFLFTNKKVYIKKINHSKD